MGQMLDKWVGRNFGQLSEMVPRGTPPVSPDIQGAPGHQGGFPQQPPVQQGFPSGGQPGFQAPVAAPVEVRNPEPQKPVEVQPRKESGMTFSDMYSQADPGSIKKTLDLLEKTTGRSVEELYEQQTGNPPPRGTKREKIGEFLLEFGLNLLAAPAGQDSISNIGQSAQKALATGRQRDQAHVAGYERKDEKRIAAEDRRLGQLDKKFDRAVVLEQLDLQRQEVEARLGQKASGKYDSYIGEDGYLYTYNEATGEGRRVMVGGKPMKPDPKTSKTAGQRFNVEVKRAMWMEVFGRTADGTPLTGEALWEVEKKALEYAADNKTRSRQEIQILAANNSMDTLSGDIDYKLAPDEEKRKMEEDRTDALIRLYMMGQKSSGEDNISKRVAAADLVEGLKTPVTNEEGVTEHWTLKNGKPVKVD